MAIRQPPLLEPYLGLPPETSLIVLTGVLGASTNWLLQRYLCSYLAHTSRSTSPAGGNGDDDGEATVQPDETKVLFVSFLRDFAFWKDGTARLGLDLEAAARAGRFIFIDGLTGLFSSTSSHAPRGRVLASASLPDFRKTLLQAIAEMQARGSSSRVVLIVDNPDLLLAAGGKAVSGEGLREVLLDVREKVHSSLVTLAADEPLVALQSTSLEKEHAALAISLAHEAEMVISLRMLDTGTAKDVSGVLRVTNGGSASGVVAEERELLYFVGGDGGVRVFERGQ